MDTIAQGDAPASIGATRGPVHPNRVLLVLTGVAMLVNYVEIMILPAVPKIQTEFGTTASLASWVVSAFLVVGSSLAPLFGRLGDAYGKRRIFLVSLSFYIIGVGAAGFSPNIYFLLASRALQGIGFAIVPLSLAIVIDVFPREKIAFAQGIISATFAIGATAGLVIGSYVTQTLGWPYAFHTALVLSLALFVVVAKVIRQDSPRSEAKVDYLGAIVLMAGIALILVYITQAPSSGWLSLEQMTILIPGLALIVFFFAYLERHRQHPLMQLGLLRDRNVLVGNVLGIFSGIILLTIMYTTVYYAELPAPFGLGLGVITVGLALAPATATMLVVAPLLGRTTPRVGPKPLIYLSAAVIAVGFSMFIFNRSTLTAVMIDALVTYVGAVSLITPLVNMVSVSLPPESIAVGVGMNVMLRQLGAAAGPVIAATVMATFTVQQASNQLVGATLPPSPTAFNILFGIGIALALLAALVNTFTRNYKFGPPGKRGHKTP
jgi:MFS family permease